MFVMIRSFYKYARNWYLWDSFINFVCEESTCTVFICAWISIKFEYYNLLKKYRRVRRMNHNSNFPNWLIPIFYFALFNFLQIYYTNNLFQQNFTYCLIFSEYYTWEFNCSLWVRYPFLGTNLLLLTRYTCCKIVINLLLMTKTWAWHIEWLKWCIKCSYDKIKETV